MTIAQQSKIVAKLAKANKAPGSLADKIAANRALHAAAAKLDAMIRASV